MRFHVAYLERHSLTDTFALEVDTAAEAARTVAVALFGPHACAIPEREAMRRAGGRFRLAYRRFDGDPLIGAPGWLTVLPVSPVKRGRDEVSVLPAREIPVCRTR